MRAAMEAAAADYEASLEKQKNREERAAARAKEREVKEREAAKQASASARHAAAQQAAAQQAAAAAAAKCAAAGGGGARPAGGRAGVGVSAPPAFVVRNPGTENTSGLRVAPPRPPPAGGGPRPRAGEPPPGMSWADWLNLQTRAEEEVRQGWWEGGHGTGAAAAAVD
jgi:hypothetical protein